MSDDQRKVDHQGMNVVLIAGILTRCDHSSCVTYKRYVASRPADGPVTPIYQMPDAGSP